MLEEMSFEKFPEICNKCWRKDYRFFVINLLLKSSDGKYMDKFEALIC